MLSKTAHLISFKNRKHPIHLMHIYKYAYYNMPHKLLKLLQEQQLPKKKLSQ